MKRIAISLRSGHELMEDIQTAIVRLRAIRISATEEKRDKPELARRLSWILADDNMEKAIKTLRAGGLAINA